jgi:hypothetical protein
MEKRKHRRVSFKAMATVQAGHITLSGVVDNLSMKGMFLKTKESLPGDSLLEISIILSGTSTVLSIKTTGLALRQTDEGIAIEFQEMDIDSFVHLRNVVALNSEDADAFHEEYYQAIMPK